MSKGHPSLPAMTVNRDFMAAVMSVGPPSFSLGLVEIKRRKSGFLALYPKEAIPRKVTDIGFSFGHRLLDPSPDQIVVQFSFHFYGFSTYHALINPNNPIVRTVLSTMVETQDYFFFLLHADKTVTSFRSELGEENLAGLMTNLPLIRAAATTDTQYHHVLSRFSINPDPPGKMLEWICCDDPHSLDPAGNPLDMTPAFRPRGFRKQHPSSPPFENPVTPTHCLQILNATMRTDILRDVHFGMHARMGRQDGHSTLEMLIRTIEDVLETWDTNAPFERVGHNPFNTHYHPFDAERDCEHDIRLLKFQLTALRAILADIRESSSFPSDPVSLSAEQIRIAERIDEHANRVFSEEEGYVPFLVSMSDYMDDFKRLMDTSSKEEMNELCERYDGFFRFAKCLEEIARGLSDGSIPRM